VDQQLPLPEIDRTGHVARLPRSKGGWRGWRAHLPVGIVGRVDARLAPSWAALEASPEEYDRAFAAILRGLDPAAVYAELRKDGVLLCHCEVGEFCHRCLVAEWFEANLDVTIPELGVECIDTPYYTDELYDFFAKMVVKDERMKAPHAAKVGTP
jgi:hypothetical protein